MGHTYPKNVFIVHLKFKFNWVFRILSGNPTLLSQRLYLSYFLYMLHSMTPLRQWFLPQVALTSARKLLKKFLVPGPYGQRLNWYIFWKAFQMILRGIRG